MDAPTPEHQRLQEADHGTPWKRWGPYVAERAWGGVREDYTEHGDAWRNLTHDQARSTAYRWSEDGMGGICDEHQRVLLAVTLWNGRDPILKERLYGLANEEGNHGEDVKELYWYEDATPTASWLKWRYHYPLCYPYEELLEENRRRGRTEPEYELVDTHALDTGHWECTLTVAKDTPGDLRWQLQVTNRSKQTEQIHILPTLWLRNIWTWKGGSRGKITHTENMLTARGSDLPPVDLTWDGNPQVLLCENETNPRRHGSEAEPGKSYKDGIHEHVITGKGSLNAGNEGTKAALWYIRDVAPGETTTITLHLSEEGKRTSIPTEQVLEHRETEADQYYNHLTGGVTAEDGRIVRQALAGTIWTKCFYNYDVSRWLDGDPGKIPPPANRGDIRNGNWRHVKIRDVLSMPDAWEYPWFAAWDLAFHTVALAHIDPTYAKEQLLALTKEWYMHPNGQMPAYEWEFSDSNPPVHAWAALEVYHITGSSDHTFLARIFQKLLLNFTWWVNQVDRDGNDLFQGGFLGMDNIGPFDRSHRPPVQGELEQSDGTAWMAMYCLDMMQIALHLSEKDPVYEDMAVKFLQHYTQIAATMNKELWDEDEQFYHDRLRLPNGQSIPVKTRSMAGLVALAAVRVVPAQTLLALPEFAERIRWFLTHQPAKCEDVITIGEDGSMLLSIPGPERLSKLLTAVFDEEEFLSPHGIRSLSKRHEKHPYSANVAGVPLGPVGYEPAESQSGMFGGNSNWRGPVWMPMNHLLTTAIRRYAQFEGLDTTTRIEGEERTLAATGDHLAERLVGLWREKNGKIPAAGDETWPEGLLLFHEYFHGDTGEGLGASHQTGWTALVADLILRRNQ